ncbi:MAG: hypothetical protein ABI863_13670 [Ginsengibacter sp.]
MKTFIAKISTNLLILGAVLSANTQSMAAVFAGTPADSTARQHYPEKPNDISPLLIGESVPAVKIPAADGKMFDLNARVAEKPTILVFYRGGW